MFNRWHRLKCGSISSLTMDFLLFRSLNQDIKEQYLSYFIKVQPVLSLRALTPFNSSITIGIVELYYIKTYSFTSKKINLERQSIVITPCSVPNFVIVIWQYCSLLKCGNWHVDSFQWGIVHLVIIYDFGYMKEK